MSRRYLLSEEEITTEINLSPMIDCIFILLIFFIVTTVFVEEPGRRGFQARRLDRRSPREEQHHHRDLVGQQGRLRRARS